MGSTAWPHDFAYDMATECLSMLSIGDSGLQDRGVRTKVGANESHRAHASWAFLCKSGRYKRTDEHRLLFL